MTTPEPPETTPAFGAVRPTTYRLFLAGVGLYVVTRDRLGRLADDWLVKAERLEAERQAQLWQKLEQQPTQSHPTVTEQRDDAGRRSELTAQVLAAVPTQTEIQTLNQRLDSLLNRLDDLPPNSPTGAR